MYFCMICFSPSVLDRLNALLEPGGVLTIDERGVIDGQIPSIKPHPNFRFNYLNHATVSLESFISIYYSTQGDSKQVFFLHNAEITTF